MSRTSSRVSEPPPPKMPGTPGPGAYARYTRTAVVLHWLIGLVLLGQIAFGFLVEDIAPEGTPEYPVVVNLHRSFGIVLGVLIVARLGWRLFHAPPPWPLSMSRWQRRAAHAVHILLYVCMIVMPLSGYVASNFSRLGMTFFGFHWPPWGPPSEAVYDFLGTVHGVTAIVFCILIAGHVLAALKHLLIDRDHVFSRML